VGSVGINPAISPSAPPRVIIITARGEEETKNAVLEKGAWAYVEKPYIIDRIKDILKRKLHTIRRFKFPLNFSFLFAFPPVPQTSPSRSPVL